MRVLVVEDEAKMRDVLKRGLEAAGYAVEVAADGEEGLARVEAGDHDAIVLDIKLPGLDGFEVCRQLRSAEVWTPVLMLTALGDIDDRITGLDAGADDYLVKPFAFGELLSRVRALIRRGRPPRPTALRCGPLSLDPATRLVAWAMPRSTCRAASSPCSSSSCTTPAMSYSAPRFDAMSGVARWTSSTRTSSTPT